MVRSVKDWEWFAVEDRSASKVQRDASTQERKQRYDTTLAHRWFTDRTTCRDAQVGADTSILAEALPLSPKIMHTEIPSSKSTTSHAHKDLIQ